MNNYNAQLGRRMRFCETCGVAIGIMTREEFAARYINAPGKCPVCGKPVHVIPKKPEGRWMSLSEARAIYKVEVRDLSAAAKSGAIPSRRERGAILVPEEKIAAVYERRF